MTRKGKRKEENNGPMSMSTVRIPDTIKVKRQKNRAMGSDLMAYSTEERQGPISYRHNELVRASSFVCLVGRHAALGTCGGWG